MLAGFAKVNEFSITDQSFKKHWKSWISYGKSTRQISIQKEIYERDEKICKKWSNQFNQYWNIESKFPLHNSKNFDYSWYRLFKQEKKNMQIQKIEKRENRKIFGNGMLWEYRRIRS
jgi:hypothetical protein